MKCYRIFSSYKAETDRQKEISTAIEKVKGGKALFFRAESGEDWYECQSEFAADTVKIAYDSDGIIRQFSKDASSLVPDNLSVTEVEPASVPEKLDIYGGWVFDGEAVKARTCAPEELQLRAETQRQNQMTSSQAIISLWQAKLLAGKPLTDNQKTKLDSWLDYMDKLESMDFTRVTDDEGYKTISWPVSPAE